MFIIMLWSLWENMGDDTSVVFDNLPVLIAFYNEHPL